MQMNRSSARRGQCNTDPESVTLKRCHGAAHWPGRDSQFLLCIE